jgi:hypothetical protein
MEFHVRPRALLAALRGSRPAGIPLVRAWVAGALVLAGAAGCETVAGPEAAPRASVTHGGSIGGTVLGAQGQPVPGAVVRTSGGASTVSGGDGQFVIGGLAAADRLPVTVEAPGYVPTTKVYQVVAGQLLTRPIHVQPAAAPVVVNAGAGGVVPFAGGGQVLIPANAFAGVAPGDPVTVRATYIDPYDPGQLATSPGDFTARTFTGDTVRLESFGMLDVDARNAAGQRLDLAPGRQVTLRFPVRGLTPATTRGLWSFDQQQGRWIEEGTVVVTPTSLDATVTSVARRKNVDDPIVPVCIRVRVLRSDNVTPRPFEFVSANGVSYSGYTQGWTDSVGMVVLQVRSNSQVSIQAGPVSQTVTTPPPGAPCPVVATLAF